MCKHVQAYYCKTQEGIKLLSNIYFKAKKMYRTVDVVEYTGMLDVQNFGI